MALTGSPVSGSANRSAYDARWKRIMDCVELKQPDRMPVVLYGSEFWQGLLDWIETTPLQERMLKKRDMKLIHVSDDIDEVVEIISRYHARDSKRHEDHTDGRDTP